MKRFVLVLFIGSLLNNANSQDISAKDFLFSSSFSPKKFESYLNKKKFFSSGTRLQFDTLVNIYSLKPEKKQNGSAITNVETYRTKNSFSFSFLTSSHTEYTESIKVLKEAGFFCGNEFDSTATNFLFQRKNISVRVNITIEPSIDTAYSFSFQQAELPSREKIKYAEDLLQFNSHEQLVSVFGEKNVMKDVYYFLDQKTTKCSVLFPHTNRQAVITWNDEVNLCSPEYLLVGGNLANSRSETFEGVIAESIWSTKEGVYSGMNLTNLVKLNGNDFQFYGKNSKFPLMVVPENTGLLDFKNNRIVLGCLNPNASLLTNPTIRTDDILNETSGIYVLMIMFLPPQPGYKDSARN